MAEDRERLGGSRGEVPVAGPFPRDLPPNHAGQFPGTWLSSDLCRVGGWLPVVDEVVADTTDHEGLSAFSGHDRSPLGLVCSGCVEACECPDLVHQHRAGIAAELAPSPHEPGNQLLARVGDPGRDAVE
jgi:hypothetical protein